MSTIRVHPVTPNAPIQPVARAPPCTNIGKWFKGLFCGSLSLISCCCCCGCAGHMKAPAVLYDYDETWDDLAREEQRTINAIQWCGIAGLAGKCVPLCCGCCCGCCGLFTPIEGAMFIGEMEKNKR